MKTIRSKLIAVLLPIMIFGMVGLGVHSIVSITAFNAITIERQIKNLSTIIDDRFENEVRRNAIDLTFIPQSEVLSSFLTADPNDLRRTFHKNRALHLLHQWVIDTPGFLQLTVLDKTGVELLKVGEGVDPFIHVDEENLLFISDWSTKEKEQSQFGELMYSKSLGQYVYKQGLSFQTLNPVQNLLAQEEQYRIILTYSVRAFANSFLSIQTQVPSYLLLLDQQHHYIAGKQPIGWHENTPSGGKIKIKQEWYTATDHRLKNGLTLQVLISDQIQQKDANELKQVTLFWVIITTLACIMMIFYVLRRFVLSPMQHLQKQIRAVAESKTFEEHSFEILDTEDEFGELHLQFADMLSRIHESRKKAERAVFIDPLTNIPNRAALHRMLIQLTEKQQAEIGTFVLIQMKLHDVSRINQTFGDRIGDQVLCLVAHAINDALLALKRWDVTGIMFFARSGGDEFSIILPAKSMVNLEDKNPVPEQFCHYMASYFDPAHPFGAYQIKISFSAGIALYPDIAHNSEQLIECASHARRRAFRMRGCHWFFMDHGLMEEVAYQKQVETALRQAIQRNELYLEFQPQYEISTRLIYSAEALLRWVSQDLGRIGPDVFIPIAERSGLILDIDLWVLEQSCAALRRLTDGGLSYFSMAINASSAELANIDYPHHVAKMLSKYQIEPERVTIEVTETAIVSVDEIAQQVVTELRMLGVEIALDDFGTGFTSLTHLSALHLDKLKIDRSYVNQLESNPRLLDSIINLGHAFDMKIVAEGVEFESQLELLKEKNCHFAQGFLLSRPVREEVLVQLLNAQGNTEMPFNMVLRQ